MEFFFNNLSIHFYKPKNVNLLSCKGNKDENIHRFVIRDRERDREREREERVLYLLPPLRGYLE